MFAFAMVAALRKGEPCAERASRMLDAWPSRSVDRVEARSSTAAVGLLRWPVVARDLRAAPIWDPVRQLLCVGDVRLFNRSELLRELVSEIRDGDPSDLELAWTAYLRWGEDGFRRLLGDFALAVWNERDRTLTIARDHFGVRPAYYWTSKDLLLAASDVGQIVAALPTHPAKSIDARMILERLLRQPVRHDLTYFRGVHSARPGHVLTLTGEGVDRRRYWSPSYRPAGSARSYEDHCEEIRHVFRQAVRDRLESDRLVVLHSSGGFDSSAIVVAASESVAESSTGPAMIIASAMTPGMPCDDSRFMDAVSRRVSFEGVRWNALESSLADLDDPLPGYPGLRRGIGGGPRRDLTLARERGAGVLLSGAFGDGVTFAVGVLRDMMIKGIWSPLLREIARGRHPLAAARAFLKSALGFLPPPVALRVLNRMAGRHRKAPPRWMGPELRASFPLPAEELDLIETDWPSHLACESWFRLTGPRARASIDSAVLYGTADGVEIRLPFLDIRLVDALLGVPAHERMPRDGDYRTIGRDALGPMLPPEFEQRRGQGSWTPVWALAAKSMLPAVRKLFNDGVWLSAPYVDRDEADRMLQTVLKDQELAKTEDLMLVTEFGVVEAWLRRVSELVPARFGV